MCVRASSQPAGSEADRTRHVLTVAGRGGDAARTGVQVAAEHDLGAVVGPLIDPHGDHFADGLGATGSWEPALSGRDRLAR